MNCRNIVSKFTVSFLLASITLGVSSVATADEPKKDQNYWLMDTHFHISNYAMQGTSLKGFLKDYLDKSPYIKRSTIMPLPLQQRWDSFEKYQVKTADGRLYGPTYYIGPKADLYYYSFIDALYAKEFLELPPAEQEKLDLMITAFNPMDMYASQHIKRAVLAYPGAFTGIGEFTIHKEVVSDKVAGESIEYTRDRSVPVPGDVYDKENGTASLYAESLRRLLKTAGEIGLVAMLHNDAYYVKVDHSGNVLDIRPGSDYLSGLVELCIAVPNTTVIWAHTGLGRFVEPLGHHLQIVETLLKTCPNWYVDISWDLVQDYILTPKTGMPSTEKWKEFFLNYSNRIIWGSDSVLYSRNRFEGSGTGIKLESPGRLLTLQEYDEVSKKMLDFINSLGEEKASEAIRFGNYEKVFNAAKIKVRQWEQVHKNDNIFDLEEKAQ